MNEPPLTERWAGVLLFRHACGLTYLRGPVDKPIDKHPLVLFDGVCGLCNRFVDRLLRWDREHVLRFAPLQGTTATQRGIDITHAGMDTVLFVDGGITYERSDAAIRIAMRLGGLWRMTAALLIFPRGLRNAVYDWIARNRYRWFGKHDSCRIPTPAERAYFLP